MTEQTATPELISPERLETLQPGDRINLGNEIFTFLRFEKERRDKPKYVESVKGIHVLVGYDTVEEEGVILQNEEEQRYGKEHWWLYKSVLLRATEDLEARWCAYCHKLLPKGEWTTSDIFVNRGISRLAFCKGTGCAGYYQMGAEG